MKKISSALMVSLMLGMLVGQSAAARSPLESASPPSEDESNPLYFCKLGCVYSLCTSLATEENPNEEKIAACADSCSKACTKDFIA
ncbi:hypothetical protein AB3S75_001214 [Citrus x aurantiifolia]